MSRTVYMECTSGICGDMAVAAMLDLGANEQVLRDAIASLPLEGYRVEIRRVIKSGLEACDFDVILDVPNHDHDMEHLHGHVHTHAHEHSEAHVHGEHHHRHLPEIEAIIDAGQLTDGARALAKKIFRILAEAEAKAHGLPADQVGFHEVGAVDSIIDIVAFAVCYDNLGITDVILTKLCEGTGTVRCQHGIMPVPVPAVANIIAAADIPIEIMPLRGEFITPTGAAIAAAVCTSQELPQPMRFERIGLGAGKRSYERPSLLRAYLLRAEKRAEQIWKLETNIDDATGENLGYVMDLLFEAGARDAHYLPCYMKKNRPAWQLGVICDEAHREVMEDILFRETTTIGIRRMPVERATQNRRQKVVTTPYGDARVKVVEWKGNVKNYPEFDDVRSLCESSGRPFTEIYHVVLQAAGEDE